MNRITLTLATVLSLAFTQVTAQDFNKGVEALAADDYAIAMKELKPLAEEGNVDAQYFLGMMYENGNGVLKDAIEAVKWYRLAAEQGDVNAQLFLGIMYKNGDGVIQDYAKALKWLRLSAEQGDADAQFRLGIIKAEGTDYLTVHMWYNIASANGHENAGDSRDELAALMTVSEITKATAMAKECMNSNYKKCGY